MVQLGDYISVRSRFARSASLERDLARQEPLEGYVATARALTVVERIASTAAKEPSGGAWSVTGPYGSGKSSLALLLDAAFGESGELRRTALRLIGEASPEVRELVNQAHTRHTTNLHGFHRGLVTAEREPLNRTVLWALYSAVLRHWGEVPSAQEFSAAMTLQAALEDAKTDDPRRRGPAPSSLIEIARCIASDRPLLLVIDEFGKNLEAVRDSDDGDPYLLQQLAEAGQGSGLPIFLVTLQHLSFEEHMEGAAGPQRREWAKVQGRFEDLVFVESPAQTRALIGTVFDAQDETLSTRIGRWAATSAKHMRSLGVGMSDLTDAGSVASWYPLHPLAAVVLPELCSRYGQHERTLFSFLTDTHTSSAASFLASTALPARGALPSVGLEEVYDYFVGTSAMNIHSARLSGRWAEIATRLRDSRGLAPEQARMAKAIALLNLISATGKIRASRQVLALVDADAERILGELEGAGLVTYRDFADEYRIWQGTDLDVRASLESARARAQRLPLAGILAEVDSPEPVVAARHSARSDVLRVFRRRYVDSSESAEPLDTFSPYDGEVLLLIGEKEALPSFERWRMIKPTVVAIPQDLSEVDATAREAASIADVLAEPAVREDWVARRELGERLAQARAGLDEALARAFSAHTCRWILLGPSEDEDEELAGGRGSSAVSEAADLAYSETPRVRNEMLNRTELTSQGAKARSLLLGAMIDHGTEHDLSLEGHGPEVAMYRALLQSTGIHRRSDHRAEMVFAEPADPSLLPAWEMLQGEFKRATARRINLNDVWAALISPPYGMKPGVIPVFVTAALLAFADEVAIYEHGTFKPLLTAEVSERMVRNPNHFDIRHFANTTGARRLVVDALAERLELRPGFRRHRVSNVLTVVAHLVSRVSKLDNFTMRTQHLTSETVGVRDALVAAVEPDELLFSTLPAALGFDPVFADLDTYPDAGDYADQAAVALDELCSYYERLLGDLLRLLLDASAETTRTVIAGQAEALEGEVLDPEMKAFLLTVASDGLDADSDWAQAVATVLVKKAPAEWSDNDLRLYRLEIHERFAAFHRLAALHHERRATDGAFDAYRVTLTHSDGREENRLVSLDPMLRSAAEDALREFTQTAGSPVRAHHALLALVGEQLLADTDADDVVHFDAVARRASHG